MLEWCSASDKFMRLYDFILEGGWANAKTQDTIITPSVIQQSLAHLQQFERKFNQYLTQQNMPEIRIGNPVGSGTYYQRDLEQQPDKQYGDIDVQFIIPRAAGGEASIQRQYAEMVKSFANLSPEYETTNGVNVIFNLDDQHIQVDFVMMFDDRVNWSRVFAPEWNTKGVISSTLFSALAQHLSVSFSDRGIQAKTRNGELVNFSLRRDTQLHTITDDASNWGVELAKFFGAQEISPMLKKHPGHPDETKISDIVKTIQGVMISLGRQNELAQIKQIYLNKIGAVINSSKFDKAQTPQAQQKAAQTKQTLYDRSREVAELIDAT